MNKSIRNVVLIMSTSGAAGRELLTGIFDYAKRGRYWNIRLLQPPCQLNAEALARFSAENIHGIITYEIGDLISRNALLHSDIPLALVGIQDSQIANRLAPTAFVVSDDYKIGWTGAKHLYELGRFKSFAFVPSAQEWSWSKERERGFTEYLSEQQISVRRFRSSESSTDRNDLLNWLRDLPKPAAIMAAWDTSAIRILDALNQLRINVPKQVAVIGVDNDELLCDFANPPLTSIWPNHHRMGFKCAEELGKLMSRNRRPTANRTIVCPPKCLVKRESTVALSPAAHIVDRATAFIDQNATLGIGVRDVVAHLRISRRLADLRFREACNKSILEAIIDRRLAAVCKQLTHSRKSADAIAATCGFGNTKHLMRLFKNRYGMTMNNYRRKSIGSEP